MSRPKKSKSKTWRERNEWQQTTARRLAQLAGLAVFFGGRMEDTYGARNLACIGASVSNERQYLRKASEVQRPMAFCSTDAEAVAYEDG